MKLPFLILQILVLRDAFIECAPVINPDLHLHYPGRGEQPAGNAPGDIYTSLNIKDRYFKQHTIDQHEETPYKPIYERFESPFPDQRNHKAEAYVEDLTNLQEVLGAHLKRKRQKFVASNLKKVALATGSQVSAPSSTNGDEDLKTDVLLISEDGTLSYSELIATAHGRHLLLVSLLEELEEQYWLPRCLGTIEFYLPNSIKSTDQPLPSAKSMMLEEVVIKGVVITKVDLLRIYKKSVMSTKPPGSSFSRFKQEDARAVNSLVKFGLEQESFGSLLSMLVVFRDLCNTHVYTDAVLSLIHARDDVGFLVPSYQSILPQDYVPIDIGKLKAENRRQKRQSSASCSFSYMTTHRTYPTNHAEYPLWHFREDIGLNSMHRNWHSLLSSASALSENPRRGEMFYYMHHQLLNRYNADRLAAGLSLVEPFCEAQWNTAMIDYNPNVFPGGFRRAARVGNYVFSASVNTRRLAAGLNQIREGIQRRQLGNQRLTFRDGKDLGIIIIGDAIEAYSGNAQFGNVHNRGHVLISSLGYRETSGQNAPVMSETGTSLRDPIFYRWHACIDSVFTTYKRSLGTSAAQLNFNGVVATGITVTSQDAVTEPETNQFFTFIEKANLYLDRDLVSTQSTARRCQFDRLNHVPYTFNISVTSGLTVPTPSMVRIFLLPSQYQNRSVENVIIEMDRFFRTLLPGPNRIIRRDVDSTLLAKGAPSLSAIQQNIIAGISRDDFFWGNCGWPYEMAVPKGTSDGMPFKLIAIVSPLLKDDSTTQSNTAWSWCGFRPGGASYPTERPMGYPFDGSVNMNFITDLPNAFVTSVTIRHLGVRT